MGLPKEDMVARSMAPQLAQAWIAEIATVGQQLAPQFARAELRSRATLYLRGLLSGVERKNSWQMAESVGDPTPYGFQHLLGRAHWDADAVRDDLRTYVIAQLGDPAAVLIIDETGFLKKGTKSVGVKRQYRGTAGRIENAQVGVFLAYAGAAGRAFLDRELYLPAEWAADAARPASRRQSPSRPNRSSRARCWSAHWMRPCRPRG